MVFIFINIDTMNLCYSRFYVLSFLSLSLAADIFVIPLWRGSGYTTMFVQGLTKITLLFMCKKSIIVLTFKSKLCYTWLLICIWEDQKRNIYFPILCRYYYDIIYYLDGRIWENLKDRDFFLLDINICRLASKILLRVHLYSWTLL